MKQDDPPDALDAWLNPWPEQTRDEKSWNALTKSVMDKVESLPVGRGDDAWFVEPLPQESGEPQHADEAAKPHEATMLQTESSTSPSRKPQSLKDLAKRISSRPQAASVPPSEPPKAESERTSRPSIPPRPSVPSRPPEAKEGDSGVVDLAKARQSAPALEGAVEPASSGLFEDDRHSSPDRSAPRQVQPAARRSWTPILTGFVGVAAVAAALFVVSRQNMTAEAPAVAQKTLASVDVPQTHPMAPPVAAAEEPKTVDLRQAESEDEQVRGEAHRITGAGGPERSTAEPSDKTAEPAEPAKPADDAKKAATDEASGEKKDLAGAMADAVGKGGAEPAGPAKRPKSSSGSIPESPSQGAIQGAIGSVIGSAKACVKGMTEASRATIVFGSSGGVQSVSVNGPAANKGAAGCIRSALMRANVGPFQRSSFTVGVTVRP